MFPQHNCTFFRQKQWYATSLRASYVFPSIIAPPLDRTSDMQSPLLTQSLQVSPKRNTDVDRFDGKTTPGWYSLLHYTKVKLLLIIPKINILPWWNQCQITQKLAGCVTVINQVLKDQDFILKCHVPLPLPCCRVGDLLPRQLHSH